jgi:hypothetical protein
MTSTEMENLRKDLKDWCDQNTFENIGSERDLDNLVDIFERHYQDATLMKAERDREFDL